MSIHAPLNPSAGGQSHDRDWHGLLVPPAMLIAAVAMGMASSLHLGLGADAAVAVGVALFCLMLMCHVLLRAADEAERAAEEAAERGIEQVTSPMPKAAAEDRQGLLPAAPMVAPATSPPPHPAMSEVAAALPEDARAPVPEPQAPQPPMDPLSSLTPPPLPAHLRELPADPPAGATAVSAWSFRPFDMREPGLSTVSSPSAVPEAAGELAGLGRLRPSPRHNGAAAPPDGPATGPADRQSERIDAILKRLASQIQAGSATSAAAQPTEPVALEIPQAPQTTAAEPSDRALASAVDALRSTVAAMRGALEADQPKPQPPPLPATSAELRIAAVAEALAAERADVYLLPILGLASEQARHFEVSVQMRSAMGEPIDARADAMGSGLLALIDALGIRHAAGFALMLERRGREGAVFSRVDGSSLESEQFVAEVAGRHAQGIADRMVLSFAQSELRGLGPAQIAALGDLGRLGFRFALQGVTDLDMDLEALVPLGFEFVKLDADVFLGGLMCGDTEIPASDMCRHFEEMGLSVIVSGIADAATREQVMVCGVVYGQGPLFGDPRPVPVAGAPDRTLAA